MTPVERFQRAQNVCELGSANGDVHWSIAQKFVAVWKLIGTLSPYFRISVSPYFRICPVSVGALKFDEAAASIKREEAESFDIFWDRLVGQ
jgi:hypothetical protein